MQTFVSRTESPADRVRYSDVSGEQPGRDIVEIRKIKANLVSINVDKLVGEGYLRREVDTDDRRKTHLLCTDKAGAVIEQGRALQNRFMDSLLAHIDDADRKQLTESIRQMEQNLDHMLEEEH